MIGVFDSGIGGLTVLRALVQSIPDHDFIYLGDTARAPYGSKSPDIILDYTLENVAYLIKQGIKALVLACNTVASVAAETVERQHRIPLFEVITPAVKQALIKTRGHRIGIIGTPATIMSGSYEKKLLRVRPEAKVYSAACPLLIPLIEESWHKKPETKMIVKKCLHPLKVRQIDTLILGCSHYGLLTKIIQAKIGKRVSLIDPSSCVADRVKTFLANHSEVDKIMIKNGSLRLIMTDVTAQVQKLTKTILKTNVPIETVRF